MKNLQEMKCVPYRISRASLAALTTGQHNGRSADQLKIIQGGIVIRHELTSAQPESRRKRWKLSVQSSLKPVLFAHRDYFYIRLPHYLTLWPRLI